MRLWPAHARSPSTFLVGRGEADVDDNCRHSGSPTESMTRSTSTSLHTQVRAKSLAIMEALVALRMIGPASRKIGVPCLAGTTLKLISTP